MKGGDWGDCSPHVSCESIYSVPRRRRKEGWVGDISDDSGRRFKPAIIRYCVGMGDLM